jgi:hypothetical protein
MGDENLKALYLRDISHGMVCYDLLQNRFVQVRKLTEDSVICGGHCCYYSDAITTIVEQPLSYDYCDTNFQPIKTVDTVGIFDGIGWKVRGKE